MLITTRLLQQTHYEIWVGLVTQLSYYIYSIKLLQITAEQITHMKIKINTINIAYHQI